MGLHVMSFTTAGGLPLFARQKGTSQSLPFSLVASLNGVHMFCKSHQVLMKYTQSKDFTVVWKDFEDSVTLIVTASTTDDSILDELLVSIFNTIVLTVGLDEVKNARTKNIERFKRDLRVCYPLIDRLLETVDLLGDRTTSSCGLLNHTDLLGFVETVLCNEALQLKSCLDAFSECIESLFACFFLGNCIAVATAGWWELTIEERKLLTLLIECFDNCTSTDMPVFLPCKSPSVPFRLVSVCVVNGVKVAALCGPSPPLVVVEQQVGKCWRPAAELLRIVQSSTACSPQQTPRSLPQNVTLHNGVIGLLLVNFLYGKYLLSRNLFGNKKEAGDVLRTFYYQTAPSILKKDGCIKGLEIYWCSEYHKLHALNVKDNLICVLYSSSIPTHTMRFITRQTMNNLLLEKQYCW
ncbi:fuzzy planar cell polarity protein-like protein [Lycorma delicatula]|uniref:fuzzy planar cell polarity protein-like protein n=1 Tax=Lycorma delicatula TaxID=130591 RepID=UPI003F5134F7